MCREKYSLLNTQAEKMSVYTRPVMQITNPCADARICVWISLKPAQLAESATCFDTSLSACPLSCVASL